MVLESGVHFPFQELPWGPDRMASLSVPGMEAVSIMERPPDALTYVRDPGGCVWAPSLARGIGLPGSEPPVTRVLVPKVSLFGHMNLCGPQPPGL